MLYNREARNFIFAFTIIGWIVYSLKSVKNVFVTEQDNPLGIAQTSINDYDGKILQNYPPFQSFNDTNPHKNSWCPNAECNNSPMCAPCNRRYLFIVASGRSGSTSLLKMLNYLPNVRLSGENRNVIYYASQLVSILEDPVPLLKQDFDRVEGAYMHNAIAKQSMACPIQQIIHTINPPPKAVQLAVNKTLEDGSPPISIQDHDKHLILGVKTIRVHKSDWTYLEAAKFFREHFPCSKVVINMRRDIEGQLKSIASTFDLKISKTRDELIAGNDFLQNFGRELGEDRAKVIDIGDWSQDVNVINDVVQWLGFRKCTFKAIIHENQGSSGLERDHSTNANLDKRCHYPV